MTPDAQRAEDFSPTASDVQLITFIALGNEDAMKELVIRHGRRLAIIADRAIGEVGTLEDVEEVVSDTFFDVWFSAPEYDPSRSSVATWLYWRLLAKALPRRRSALKLQRAQRHLDTDDDAVDESDDLLQIDDRLDARKKLEHALSQLRQHFPQDADLIHRRYFLDQSPTDIAAAMGISNSLARVRLFRALQKLRPLIESEEDYK